MIVQATVLPDDEPAKVAEKQELPFETKQKKGGALKEVTKEEAEAAAAELEKMDGVSLSSEGVEENSYSLKYGWNNEVGAFLHADLREQIPVWWKRPSYLTPNGYPEPPHWSKKNYALCCEELKFAQIEATIMRDLKAMGMTREEIDARAAMYEFQEDDDRPRMTEKMKKLMQVSALLQGLDDFYIIDMRRRPPKGEPPKTKRERTKTDWEKKYPKPA